MTDREKVIKGLECCSMPGDKRDCDLCPIGFGEGCALKLKRDALALLKAQEPVEPKVVDTSSSKLYHSKMFKNHYCGYCGEFLHIVNRKDLFCSHCGKAVKWE